MALTWLSLNKKDMMSRNCLNVKSNKDEVELAELSVKSAEIKSSYCGDF
jgi:hypothetical protein